MRGDTGTETDTRTERRPPAALTGSEPEPEPATFGTETLRAPLSRSWASLAGRRPAARGRARLLAGVCLAFYLGQGLAGTGALLYLTGPVRLSVGAVGGCMTSAGLLGLLAAVPAGRVCDRFGPKPVFAAALAAMAVAAFGFLAVRTVPEALAVACLYSAACQSAYTSRGALAAFVDADDPARLNASLYRAGNLGYALATPAIGGAAARGTAAAYVFVLLGAGAAFGTAAVGGVFVRARRPIAGSDGDDDAERQIRGRRAAGPLRDTRFLALTGLYGLTSLQFMITEFALPLWVVDHTRAPRIVVGVAALISTVLVVAVQPIASRRISSTRWAAWAMAASGIAAGAGCLALAASQGRGARSAAALVLIGAVALAAAEVVQVIGAITLSYRLAPASAVGVYQGVFTLGQGLAMAAGPALLARTVLRPGSGWTGAAVLLAVAGLLVPAVAGNGRVHPEPEPRPTES
ncbi:MFS transporter [Actinospica sp. MGRD01-02]|uniref:MFS transporter n=1 Tax=Actinospica acidithermotolerans TaxID=2828514 RepID=A0A941IJH5_9ACTN|nr:MFS transporter [Actinospica acidithermotolerans]MBR7825731.1 MFS transporter [Actinospica acidithermotolerans]